MSTRTQRFSVLDVVYDTRAIFVPFGTPLTIQEAYNEPMDENFSHCSGHSARYRATTPDGTPVIVWDWHLSYEPNNRPKV